MSLILGPCYDNANSESQALPLPVAGSCEHLMVVNTGREIMYLFYLWLSENLAESVQIVQSDQTLLYSSVYYKVSYLSSVCVVL